MSSMKQIDHPSAVDGPVVSEGGRGPSALSTGQAPTTPAMVPGATVPPATALPKVAPLAPGQRWSVARKREVVLRLLRGESAELLSRELGVPLFKLAQWRQKADAALDGALRGSGHCPGLRRRPPAPNSPPPCSASASAAWRSNCSAPATPSR